MYRICSCVVGLVILTGGIQMGGQKQSAVAPEVTTPSYDSTFLPYQGYGSVTVVSDGVVIVRLDGDAPSDDVEWREPLASYALMINPEGLSLVNAGCDWFLDWNGTDPAEETIYSADEVSMIQLGDQSQEDAGACQRRSVLEIKGEIVFELPSGTAPGYLAGSDSTMAKFFQMDFELNQEEKNGDFVWQPCCRISCIPHGGCWICCGLGIREHADCRCVNGQPVCECVSNNIGAQLQSETEFLYDSDSTIEESPVEGGND